MKKIRKPLVVLRHPLLWAVIALLAAVSVPTLAQLLRSYKGAGAMRWKATTLCAPSFPDSKAVVDFSAEARQQADCIYSNGQEAVPRTVEVSEQQT